MEATTSSEKNDKKVTLIIQTPVGKWEHPFEPDTTVSAIIAATLEHFSGKLTGGTYELRRKGSETPLEPEQTIESLKLEDKETLNLLPATPGGGK